MAPAPQLSAPGTAAYDSNTMHVGDGTWDFTMNTFLLPNLVGMNVETMRYNGMGNRFSTAPQYHRLVLAHGIIAVFVFLLFVPVAVFYARFSIRRPERAITHHSRLQLLSLLLLIVVFALGNLAVGPSRSLTNPHHGIGVAIFVLFILQFFGGWIVRHITKSRSLRLGVHRWFGRITATLGIIQVPLGLTLYGSPLYLFILYAIWMTFLLVLYFILDHRRDRHGNHAPIRGDSRRGSSYISDSERATTVRTTPRRREKEESGWSRWLLPAAAGAGLWAMLRGRRDKERNRSQSRGRNASSSRFSRSRSAAPRAHSSRRGSSRRGSYYDDEKYSGRTEQQKHSGGSRFGRLLLGLGAAFGLGKLMRHRREQTRDEGYSEVSTATPNRHKRTRPPPTETDFTETDTSYSPAGDRTTLAGAHSAAAAHRARHRSRSRSQSRPRSRPRSRPTTPRPSRPPVNTRYSYDDSEWTQSPSRHIESSRHGAESSRHGAEKKGILAGLGLGWLASRFASRKQPDGTDDSRSDARIREEEGRRSGAVPPRYTADGYSATTANTPSRKRTQRSTSHSVPPAAPTPVRTAVSFSNISEEEASTIEPQPGRSNLSGPPMPPLVAGAAAAGSSSAARPGSSRPPSQGRQGANDPVRMPAMPPDPHGPFYSDNSGGPASPSTQSGRKRTRRHRAGSEAAAAAAAAAGNLAAAERRAEAEREANTPPKPPVHIRMQVHDDRDRNVTFRRMTEEEIAGRPRHRSDSISSSEGTETPGSRRGYRRDSSVRRAEEQAERRVGQDPSHVTLIPPRARSSSASARKPKDSAYYSGQPGQLAPGVGLQPGASGTVSSIATTDTSGVDTAEGSAAEIRRYRRRQERRRPEGSSAAHDNGSDMWT